MIAPAGSGWQTIIADLALILFMVSIAATGEGPNAPPVEPPALVSAEPVAIYRTAEGGPTLGQWLAEQPADPRQQLTITARFIKGGADAASGAALALAAEAHAAGRPARIVIEPGEQADLVAVLAFDDALASWHGPCSNSEMGPAKGVSAPVEQRHVGCE